MTPKLRQAGLNTNRAQAPPEAPLNIPRNLVVMKLRAIYERLGRWNENLIKITVVAMG